MRGHFAVLRSNLYIYFTTSYVVVYLVSLDSQRNRLFRNIIYVNIGKQTVKGGIREYETWFFHFYFFELRYLP